MGVYVPECKADGGFEAVQCNMAAGYCWCVDDSGTEVKGSKVRGRPRCGKAIYNSRGSESHVNEKAFLWLLPPIGSEARYVAEMSD